MELGLEWGGECLLSNIFYQLYDYFSETPAIKNKRQNRLAILGYSYR